MSVSIYTTTDDGDHFAQGTGYASPADALAFLTRMIDAERASLPGRVKRGELTQDRADHYAEQMGAHAAAIADGTALRILTTDLGRYRATFNGATHTVQVQDAPTGDEVPAADPVTFTDGDGIVWDMAYATCPACSHALALEDRSPYGSMGRLFVCPGCGMRCDEPTFDPAEVAYMGEADDAEDTPADPTPAPADRGPRGYVAYPGGKPGTCGACGWDGYGTKGTACGWCSESAVPLLDIDHVARGYMTAAAWADAVPHGMGDDGETGGLQGETFAPGEVDRVKAHVRAFIAANRVHAAVYAERRAFDPAEGTIGDYFGHDLRLTEGGHGTGFWDRDTAPHTLPEHVATFNVAREHLSEAARAIYAADCWQQADGTLTFDNFPAEQAAQVSA